MEFIRSLKSIAQQIIELSEQLEGRVHTWDQDSSAPSSGYTDRAGFLVNDDIELCADVYATENESESLLRARLAWSPKDKVQILFTIITLDFTSDSEKISALIASSENLTQQDLVTILGDVNTIPKLIHVSLESGKDFAGNSVGKRYEYRTEQIENLTELDQKEFISTLNQAYELILSKV